MNELVIYSTNLPDKMEDLSRFVLIGHEKLNSVRAEIRAIDKLKLAQEVRNQKMEEASMLSDVLLDAEIRLGELFSQIPKMKNNNPDGKNQHTGGQPRSGAELTSKTKTEIIEDLGFSQDQAHRFEILANNKELVEVVKAEAKENGELPTRTRILELAAYKKKQKNDDEIYSGTKIISMTDFQKEQELQCDEYDDYIDLGMKIYKELAKIIDNIDKFEITPYRMEALCENYDGVMTVENQIQFINMAINKLNLIKVELRKGKK